MNPLLFFACALTFVPLAESCAQDMKKADDATVNKELGGSIPSAGGFTGTTQTTQRRILALAPVEDVPGLPRVLIVGDSISIGYTLAVREALLGKANVHRLPLNCGGTRFARSRIQKWLADAGTQKWDVIVYNAGLHDLRAVEKTRKPITVDQYEQFLREILAKLEATGAKIVWVTTTPLPPASNRQAELRALNDRARKVVDEKALYVVDLHAAALARQKEFQIPADVHFSVEGYAHLGGIVAEGLAKKLH